MREESWRNGGRGLKVYWLQPRSGSLDFVSGSVAIANGLDHKRHFLTVAEPPVATMTGKTGSPKAARIRQTFA
jgi:hypothetical protein